jgi:hypothetical protein
LVRATVRRRRRQLDAGRPVRYRRARLYPAVVALTHASPRQGFAAGGHAACASGRPVSPTGCLGRGGQIWCGGPANGRRGGRSQRPACAQPLATDGGDSHAASGRAAAGHGSAAQAWAEPGNARAGAKAWARPLNFFAGADGSGVDDTHGIDCGEPSRLGARALEDNEPRGQRGCLRSTTALMEP